MRGSQQGGKRRPYDKYCKSLNTENNSKEKEEWKSMEGLCVSYWWSMSQTAFIISHRHIFLRHAQYLQKAFDMSVFFLPRETLAGTARRSIQNDTHESITMSVAGKYVCSRKKKMWRRNVKLMQRRLYHPANAAREQLTCGGMLQDTDMQRLVET